MRKHILAMGLIILFLAIFIPFASTSPDGLEKVAEIVGVEENAPLWTGLMSDYSVEAAGNSYVSTLIAGIFGTVLVLLASMVLGKALEKKSNHAIGEEV